MGGDDRGEKARLRPSPPLFFLIFFLKISSLHLSYNRVALCYRRRAGRERRVCENISHTRRLTIMWIIRELPLITVVFAPVPPVAC
jgi:hypothetical protein